MGGSQKQLSGTVTPCHVVEQILRAMMNQERWHPFH